MHHKEFGSRAPLKTLGELTALHRSSIAGFRSWDSRRKGRDGREERGKGQPSYTNISPPLIHRHENKPL